MEIRTLSYNQLGPALQQRTVYGTYGFSKRRVAFDTMSYDVVKEISSVAKRNYRVLVGVKREMED